MSSVSFIKGGAESADGLKARPLETVFQVSQEGIRMRFEAKRDLWLKHARFVSIAELLVLENLRLDKNPAPSRGEFGTMAIYCAGAGGVEESRFMLFPRVRLALVISLSVSGSGCLEREQEDPRLLLLCAAGMREPVSKAISKFEKETGVEVDVQFGGSGSLLAMIDQVEADLYLAADDDYIEEASRRGSVFSRHRLGFQSPVLAWNSAKKFDVTSLSDWVRGSTRAGMALPKTSAIGKVTEEVLKLEGELEEMAPRAHFVTVYELANAIQLGSVDSGIIWDTVAAQYKGFSVQELSELSEVVSAVEVAVLLSSSFPDLATELAEFLSNDKVARDLFEAHGLKTEETP